MTLLEAIVALVILSLVSLSCLELAHGATRLESSSVAWNDAVSAAESRMAAAMVGAPADASIANANGTVPRAALSSDDAVVTRTPWRHGLDDIEVSTKGTDGVVFTLHRLVPSVPSVRSGR